MSDINELKKTLLKIRNESYQDIPEAIISEILSIQDKYAQDRSESFKQIRRIIEDHVNSLEFD